MSMTTTPEPSFAGLDLPAFLLETLNKVGYEKPSPIQQATIPTLLQGKDIIGMAQTGTGKTAAFALPILAHIDTSKPNIQALVLCPTRELAIQVAEAFQTYAQGLRGFHVLPIYGGQDMGRQLQALKRGVHVVVGTPGRLLDHLRRRSLDLHQISTLVLDEADEMLRMGFIDDVETILQQTPEKRQVALFSATMPAPIRSVAEKYLNDPQEVKIQSAASTNANIEQFYWLVQGTNKLDALTRILEVEDFDGMIIFVRTKNNTVELADKLNARGFSAAPLNGDMNQQHRTRTVEQLKNGSLDIVIATDVAARGLDVERISHVMNYDIPYDNEAYVHRIGRTGRAGRSGKAILFVTPRERRLLQSIERTTRKKIERMELPTRADLVQRRSEQFKQTIIQAINNEELDFFHELLADLCQEQACPIEDVAAAMASLLQKNRPLNPPIKEKTFKQEERRQTKANASSTNKADAPEKRRQHRTEELSIGDIRMEQFRLAVGHTHGASPKDIVGAIANEAGIEGRYIGRIDIFDDYTIVDLPEGMPDDIFQTLQRTRVRSQPLAIRRLDDDKPGSRFKAKSKIRKQNDNHRPMRKTPRRPDFTEPTKPPHKAHRDDLDTAAKRKGKNGNPALKAKKRNAPKKRVNKSNSKHRAPSFKQ